MTTIIMGIFIRSNYINKITDEQLFERFKQYGFIKNIFRPIDPLKQYCIVRFREKASIQRALAEVHIIGNVKLNCYPEKENGSWHLIGSQLPALVNANLENMAQQVTKEEKPLVEFSRLKITNEMSFDNAVDLLIKDIEAPAVEKSFYSQVCSDLECIFKQELPGVKAVIFGSRLTGLALKNSDLDVFMECPNDSYNENFQLEMLKLLTDSEIFESVQTRGIAKLPLFRCAHKKTGLNCNITFFTKLCTFRTSLVDFVIKADDRVRKAFMAIKIWKRCYSFPNKSFSSYSMFLMFLFYLQRLGVFPPIKELFDSISEKKTHKGWQYNFCQDWSPKSAKRYVPSVKEMISGFFKYYSEFDYTDLIICPYVGEPVKKAFFFNNFFVSEKYDHRLLHNFQNYIEVVGSKPYRYHLKVDERLICVQDPICLSHNVTGHCSRFALKRFVETCKIAHETGFLDNRTNSSAIILRVLTRNIRDKSPDARDSATKSYVMGIFRGTASFNFDKFKKSINVFNTNKTNTFDENNLEAVTNKYKFSNLYAVVCCMLLLILKMARKLLINMLTILLIIAMCCTCFRNVVLNMFASIFFYLYQPTFKMLIDDLFIYFNWFAVKSRLFISS